MKDCGCFEILDILLPPILILDEGSLFLYLVMRACEAFYTCDSLTCNVVKDYDKNGSDIETYCITKHFGFFDLSWH